MRNRSLLALLSVVALWAQAPQPSSSVKVNFPNDSPVALVSADWGESRTEARGGALLLDLHTSLSLRNTGQARIRGVTLLVQAQEVTAGGKASVTVPSVDIGPGETFPIRIDLRLLRPMMGGGPLAEITLDGVLFENLSFYGPNRLNSRRAMTVWELEARRDRRYLKSILESRGPEGLRQEALATLARLADRPQLDVQVIPRGRTTAVASAAERPIEFVCLHLPDAPLEPVGGLARVVGGEARAPRIEVVNRSSRPVRYFEIGWIVKDRQGREFLAGSVPAAESGLRLAPGATSEVAEGAALRFSRAAGQPVDIAGMTAFVTQVEFADGTLWIPSRAALDTPRFRAVLAPSPEEQRLADLYRKKGLAALVTELKKF
ncbi:MAG: hypothetical protein ABSH46_18735 [Bryobacteraceae bacterium]